MEIRIMTIDDYDEVYRLWSRTAGMGLNGTDDSREGIARFLKRNPATNFVAIAEGEIAGVVLCGHDGRRGHIYHLAVDDKYRRRGIGRTLLSSAMDALGKEGIRKASVVVFQSNGTGNAFWEAEGFEERADLVYRNKHTSLGEK